MLKNKIVVVESCHPVSKKHKLEKLVTKHGGKVILDSHWLTSQNTSLFGCPDLAEQCAGQDSSLHRDRNESEGSECCQDKKC